MKELKRAYTLLKSTSVEDLEEVLTKKKYYPFLNEFVIVNKSDTVSNVTNAEDDCMEDEIHNADMENMSNQGKNLNYSDSDLWSDEEIRDLLKICIDSDLYYYKDSKASKNKDIYELIHACLEKNGCNKTYQSMVDKINSLNSEYVKIKKCLGTSGEVGVAKLNECRTYWEEMNTLFSKRTKSDTPTYDTLDPGNLQGLLETSINRDKDLKIRFPKSQWSNMKGVLSSALQGIQKHSDAQLERTMQHEDIMAQKQMQFVGGIIKESTATIVEALKEVAPKKNDANYMPQFSPHPTLGQYPGAFPNYSAMIPTPSSTRPNSDNDLQKRKKKDKHRHNKHLKQ